MAVKAAAGNEFVEFDGEARFLFDRLKAAAALEANAGIREDPAAFAHDAAHVFVGISFERVEAARWNFDLDLKNLWLGEKVLRLGFGLFSCRPSVEEGTQKGHQHSNRLT